MFQTNTSYILDTHPRVEAGAHAHGSRSNRTRTPKQLHADAEVNRTQTPKQPRGFRSYNVLKLKEPGAEA